MRTLLNTAKRISSPLDTASKLAIYQQRFGGVLAFLRREAKEISDNVEAARLRREIDIATQASSTQKEPGEESPVREYRVMLWSLFGLLTKGPRLTRKQVSVFHRTMSECLSRVPRETSITGKLRALEDMVAFAELAFVMNLATL